MTTSEYFQYQLAVAQFFEREGIENLSSHRYTCESCHHKLNFDGPLPACGTEDCKAFGEPIYDQPFFGSAQCDCCKTGLAGDRLDASGYNRAAQKVYEYTVCFDCIYFCEYGKLDDTTMLDMEDDTRESQGFEEDTPIEVVIDFLAENGNVPLAEVMKRYYKIPSKA